MAFGSQAFVSCTMSRWSGTRIGARKLVSRAILRLRLPLRYCSRFRLEQRPRSSSGTAYPKLQWDRMFEALVGQQTRGSCGTSSPTNQDTESQAKKYSQITTSVSRKKVSVGKPCDSAMPTERKTIYVTTIAKWMLTISHVFLWL